MKQILSFFMKQQLLQFAVVAGLIFLLFKFTATSSKPEIVVTNAVIEDLVDLKSQVLGHKLNEEERKDLISNYIDEEVLLREAYNQGLDRNDTKLRERLIDKMRFLLSKEVDEPTEDTLKVFYNKHIELYMTREFITFDQVFFSNDSEHEENEHFLEQLEKTEDFASLGDFSPLGNHLKSYAKSDLNIMLGEEFTSFLFQSKIGNWQGPIMSSRGLHYIRVLDKVEAKPYPFENVREFVREDWSVFQSQSSFSKKIEALKKEYSIKVIE